ncbi:polyphosphate kinase 1 [Crocinitomix algicola]|uniref:polyphosphate kinase 1 n=1 Tax=Crocinitomix algicola TaxID=1740263 RepID=UPI000871C684|nr:polyphosphate kinase 1 [Crocinitomix algicola]
MKLFNRELSWLSFNERVLQESLDLSNPLVERIRFLGIYSNNMDEFYRVRVASVRRLTSIGKVKIEGFSGGPKALLTEIKKVVLDQQRMFELSYQKIIRELKEHHILQTDAKHLRPDEASFVQELFHEKIRAEIVPIMLSSKRPFPHLKDGGNYLGVKMTSFEKSRIKYALVEIPKNVKRFVIIPTEEGSPKKIILLDDIIRYNLAEIFSIFNYDEITAHSFKITRDAELDVDDDISKSYLEKMKESVEMRKVGETVRFVYDSSMPIDQLQYLMDALKLQPGENIIPGGVYHNFRDFMGFPDFGIKTLTFKKRKALQHPIFKNSDKPLIKEILNQDILLTYPFQTFQHVVNILREAAIDPKVLSIKINLYRVAPNSQIINALISAAQNGVKVTAIIELKARFDESNNIKWSNYLEDNGVNVLFGVQNLKVHSKLFIIKRKSGNKTQSIAHIGTGNFHEKTANIYTDCSLLTANKSITREVEKVFKIFKNNFDRSVFRELIISPFNIRRKITGLIDREIELVKKGEEGRITIKLNNLVDAKIIKKLYEASSAGVKINCIIRGICALIPGVEGLSENITVRSIVGQYLEHTRILVFNNGGDPKYFISSADWMTRNIDRRIEATVPIYDENIKKDLQFMLDAYFLDNQKARVIDESQSNKNVKSQLTKKYNAQTEIYNYFQSKLKSN